MPVTNCFLCLAGRQAGRQAGKQNANRRNIISRVCKRSVLVLQEDVVESAEILKSLEWRVYNMPKWEIFMGELTWHLPEERRETGRPPGWEARIEVGFGSFRQPSPPSPPPPKVTTQTVFWTITHHNTVQTRLSTYHITSLFYMLRPNTAIFRDIVQYTGHYWR